MPLIFMWEDGLMGFTAAVAGASGYAGGEILRLLARHPHVEVVTATAHSHAGSLVTDVHPHLRSYRGLRFLDTTAQNLLGVDVVFFALPHGHSGGIAAELQSLTAIAAAESGGKTQQGPLLIDCGADHRLTSKANWDSFYGGSFNEPWVYGVPELPVGTGKQRDHLAKARQIAAPGCNASTVALSLAPGVKHGLIEVDDIVSTLAVGPSGAGRALKPHLLASELLGNANPYAVGGTHRHIPEIQEALMRAFGTDTKIEQSDMRITFTPVLIPVPRGILAVSTARVQKDVTAADLQAAWNETYRDEPFVEVLPATQNPTTAMTIGANTALLGVTLDRASGRATIIGATDNLTKGTAGAAIQSMNIALNIPEQTGLTTDGVAP